MRARPERRFTHRLAAHLGYTHRELLDRLTAREVTEWQAFERLEGPLGELRGDVHTAMICAALYNTNREKGSQAAKPADFLPQWDKPQPQQQSPAEMLESARALTVALGGEIISR